MERRIPNKIMKKRSHSLTNNDLNIIDDISNFFSIIFILIIGAFLGVALLSPIFYLNFKPKIEIISFQNTTVYPNVNKLLQMAEISYKVDCGILPKKQASDQLGVNIAGKYNSLTDTIVIYNNTCGDNCDITLNHEKTHQRQNNESRLFNCSDPEGVFINEMEAYTSTFRL